MPYEVTLEHERRLARIRMWGAVTPDEVRGVVAEVNAQTRERPGLSQLADLRGLTSIAAIRAGDVRAIAAGMLTASPRRAIVTADAATFGLARMFAAVRNLKDPEEQIGVFRTMAEAEQWLGAVA